MRALELAELAGGLSEAWRSQVLAEVGTASVKVLRMDGTPVPEEVHGVTEVLLVLDGLLELEVAGEPVSVAAGGAYVMPAGTTHAVRAGSRGTLVIVEVDGA
ncbi:cupin domain-containing protein [Kitasatospora sp. NPDC054939]